MQYILTEEEYQALTKKKDWKAGVGVTGKRLQQICTKVADEMPIKWSWGGSNPEPWGCIITKEKQGEEWYCDQCPVQDICPHPYKAWSQ